MNHFSASEHLAGWYLVVHFDSTSEALFGGSFFLKDVRWIANLFGSVNFKGIAWPEAL